MPLCTLTDGKYALLAYPGICPNLDIPVMFSNTTSMEAARNAADWPGFVLDVVVSAIGSQTSVTPVIQPGMSRLCGLQLRL